MKNRKYIYLTTPLVFIIVFIVYILVDRFYFLEVSKYIDASTLGYGSSFIVYEKRTLLIIILLILGSIFSCLFIYLFYRQEKRHEQYLKGIKVRLEQITKGDYSLSIQELETFGSLYDDLYKLILELREKSEFNEKSKNELKKTLENISHQLKTPLASLEILTELDRIQHKDAYLDQIGMEIHHMNELITTLLSRARFEVNEITLKRETIYIDEVVQAALENLAPIIEKSPIIIVTEGEGFPVQGDFSWLVEAFINVIKNSLEHGREKICIRYNRENVYSIVTIQDDGPGFNERDVRNIFKRFYRSDEHGSGVGIGLNLSQTILEQHDASISVKNDEGGVYIIKFY